VDYNNKNIVLSELIGLRCKVVKSLDRNQIGVSGTVVDETKNTLVIETDLGAKRIAKRISTFKFYSEGKAFIVKGEEINFRPHERISKAVKFYRARKV
jgi:ribonuclease P protein subunit POP4